MPEFHSIAIKAIHKTTSDCSIISFDIPKELKSDFQYKQGQYLSLKATVNGEELVRSYSLCSSPLDDEWSVGIKQIPDGRFSSYANQKLKVGDHLEIAPPDGHFYIGLEPKSKKQYVAFAAGSGITPILSIIKTHLAGEPNSNFKLFYVNKTAASVILKEQLEALKNLYMDRFEIFYFLTQEHRSVPLFQGRLDEQKMETIFKNICDTKEINDYFSCGPEAMVLMIRDFLINKGVVKTSIHFELFHAEGAAPEIKEQLAAEYEGEVSEIILQEGGKTIQFKIPRASDNILDAALKNAADLPYACKGGVCCTCKAKLVEGEVKMMLDYGLEEDEKEAGYILTCQSFPLTETVKVDFDI